MAGRSDDHRDRTERAGHRAEWLALLWLAVRGHRILARRYGVKGGEIDLVVRRGTMVIFVEVKARATPEAALLALTETKRRRIERAAATWLARNPWAQSHSFRGDAVLVTPRHLPRQIEGAFELRIG